MLGLPRLPQEAEFWGLWVFKWAPLRRALSAGRAPGTGGRVQPCQDSHGHTVKCQAAAGANAWKPGSQQALRGAVLHPHRRDAPTKLLRERSGLELLE